MQGATQTVLMRQRSRGMAVERQQHRVSVSDQRPSLFRQVSGVGEVRFAPPELNTTIVEGDDDCGSTSSARVVADQTPQLLQQPSVRARNKRALHAEIEKEREALEAANHAPRWMIHPSNRYKKAWDIGIFAVVFYMVYALPYSLGFTNPESELILQPDTEERIALSGYCQEDTPLLPELEPLKYAIILPITPSILDYIDSVTEVIFFIDMILSFRTGYLPKGSGVIEFRSRKVAVNYLKSWFFIDLIACIPLEELVSAINIAGDAKDLLILKMMRLPRLIRLSRLLKALDHMASANIFRVIKLLMIYVTVAHWVACAFFFQARWQIETLKTSATNEYTGDPWIRQQCLTMADWKTQYSMSLHWAFTTMTTVGYGDILPATNMDRLCTILVMLIGGLLQAVIFGNVSVLLQNLDAGSSRLQSFLDSLKEVITFHKLPPELGSRMLNSAEYQYSFNQGLHTDEVLERFNGSLAIDIRVELMREMIGKMPIFRDNGNGFIRGIVGFFEPKIFTPEEDVVREGDGGQEMYFIQDGRCKVVSGDDNAVEYARLGKGDFFGEIDVILGTKRTATVKTITHCTTYMLTRESLETVLQEFPHLVGPIKDQALARREELNRMNVVSVMKSAGSGFHRLQLHSEIQGRGDTVTGEVRRSEGSMIEYCQGRLSVDEWRQPSASSGLRAHSATGATGGDVPEAVQTRMLELKARLTMAKRSDSLGKGSRASRDGVSDAGSSAQTGTHAPTKSKASQREQRATIKRLMEQQGAAFNELQERMHALHQKQMGLKAKLLQGATMPSSSSASSSISQSKPYQHI